MDQNYEIKITMGLFIYLFIYLFLINPVVPTVAGDLNQIKDTLWLCSTCGHLVSEESPSWHWDVLNQ